MAFITIITPTYNRADNLVKLYQSLMNQTEQDFIWYISDDGSNDATESYVAEWTKSATFPIRYLKKDNGGKHTAINAAMPQIETPLSIIVDSDDWLLKDAIAIVHEAFKTYGDDKKLCGFAYLRQKEQGEYLTNKLVPVDGMRETYCECRLGRDIRGDMAEVWFTRCLKEYPFPEFPGEKFISEDTVWIKMAQKYDLIFYNKAICEGEYLNDGLTSNRREHNKKSPKGCMYKGKIMLEANLNFKYQCRGMLYYLVYGKFAGYSYSKLYQEIGKKGLYILMLLPAMYLHYRWK